jgi:hypothetical protein
MKLILLVAVIAVLWYALRWERYVEAARRVAAERAKPRRPRPPAWALGATDAEACPRCRAYVPAEAATACDRADCPLGRAGP